MDIGENIKVFGADGTPRPEMSPRQREDYQRAARLLESAISVRTVVVVGGASVAAKQRKAKEKAKA